MTTSTSWSQNVKSETKTTEREKINGYTFYGKIDFNLTFLPATSETNIGYT